MNTLGTWSPDLLVTFIAVGLIVVFYFAKFPANKRPPRWWWDR